MQPFFWYKKNISSSSKLLDWFVNKATSMGRYYAVLLLLFVLTSVVISIMLSYLLNLSIRYLLFILLFWVFSVLTIGYRMTNLLYSLSQKYYHSKTVDIQLKMEKEFLEINVYENNISEGSIKIPYLSVENVQKSLDGISFKITVSMKNVTYAGDILTKYFKKKSKTDILLPLNDTEGSDILGVFLISANKPLSLV